METPEGRFLPGNSSYLRSVFALHPSQSPSGTTFVTVRLPFDSLRLLRAFASAVACHERGGEAAESNGGQGRNRTSDTRIFSAVLYQLSYLAPVNWEKRPKRRSSISKGVCNNSARPF